MPAEQALTEARKRAGPGYGGGGGADAFRARLEESAALISPLALILGLALAGGGFDLTPRHVAGLAVWLVVVGLLAFGAAGRAAFGRLFYWASGLILALALWSAFSSLWSGSVELSVTEADRVLVYLGVFLAAFLIAQTDKRRQRFAEGISIGVVGIAFIAIGGRLLPHVLDVSTLGGGPRLGYPLHYWNADGVVFGVAAALMLWMSRRSLTGWLRWFAVASLPVALLALYLTYSRGGLLALVIACGCLIALSHDRLWLLATLAIGALATVPALLAVQARDGVANNILAPSTIDQGAEVLLFLLAGVILALALFAGLRRLEAGASTTTGKALEISRDPKVLRWTAIVGAVVALAAVIIVGGRAWDSFTSPDQQFPSASPSAHFGQLSSANRDEYWRVALDTFGEEPLIGTGAGTYQFSWDEKRDLPLPVLDAHSLYLETFSELGLVGGIVVIAMMLVLLWAGLQAWRAARGARQELYAALFAVCLAFGVSAGIDWYWEIAAVGSVFFLAAAVLVAARCSQLMQLRAASNGHGEQRRYGLAIAGLAIAWITALALVGPLLVDREIDASKAAVAAGNLPSAVDHADTARSIEPWAASPYVQLALVAEAQGEYEAAAGRFGQAIEREEGNWLLYYLRARVESAGGNLEAARADRAEARRLNPREECLQGGFEGCG
jgi:hypothetical protein